MVDPDSGYRVVSCMYVPRKFPFKDVLLGKVTLLEGIKQLLLDVHVQR